MDSDAIIHEVLYLEGKIEQLEETLEETETLLGAQRYENGLLEAKRQILKDEVSKLRVSNAAKERAITELIVERDHLQYLIDSEYD